MVGNGKRVFVMGEECWGTVTGTCSPEYDKDNNEVPCFEVKVDSDGEIVSVPLYMIVLIGK